MTISPPKRDYAAELGTLGYPKFSYVKKATTPQPAKLLLDAIDEPELNSRVAEGLPWLALTYVRHGLGLACAERQVASLPKPVGLRPFIGERTCAAQERQRVLIEAPAAIGNIGDGPAFGGGHILP